MEQGHHQRVWAVSFGWHAGPLVAGRTGHRLAAPLPGAAALSGGASRPPGDQSRVAPARCGGTHVTDTVLRVSVHEIRQALGDAAAAPRYLATVGRQGYRFLLGDAQEDPPADDRPPRRTPGRSRDLSTVVPAGGPRRSPACLAQWRSRDWQDDRGGCGAGPPGPREWGADRTGPVCRALWRGEPYLPLLEALGQLCRGPRTRLCWPCCAATPRCGWCNCSGCSAKPSWSTCNATCRASAARMLRELAEALDVLTADVPLLLVLEDLQLE